MAHQCKCLCWRQEMGAEEESIRYIIIYFSFSHYLANQAAYVWFLYVAIFVQLEKRAKSFYRIRLQFLSQITFDNLLGSQSENFLISGKFINGINFMCKLMKALYYTTYFILRAWKLPMKLSKAPTSVFTLLLPFNILWSHSPYINPQLKLSPR